MRNSKLLQREDGVKITVITINFNNLNGLKRTIPSVFSQTYNQYEYIIVDGGSTDGSKEYIEQYSPLIDEWVSEPDKGVYNAMNKAIKMAHGEFCIFMNSGDHFYSPTVLDEVLPSLNDADIYTGYTLRIGDKQVDIWAPPVELDMHFMMYESLSHQATFTRTSILKERPFSEEYKIVSDWESFFKAWYQQKCKYQMLDSTIAVYYLDGISGNFNLCVKERKKVIKEILGKDVPSDYYCSSVDVTQYLTSTQLKRKKLFEQKIKSAMNLSPVSRDMKILRNSFKFLIKDLFLK